MGLRVWFVGYIYMGKKNGYGEWRDESDRWVIGRVECEDVGKEKVVAVGLDGYVHWDRLCAGLWVCAWS